MFTTGFKYFFGLCLALAVAAVVHGYASGGSHVGPISLGWKGGVGDHLGYATLVALSTVSGVIGTVLVSFRDADPGPQAELVGTDAVTTAPRVTPSFWPVVGAFGAATMAIGLVLNTGIFITGLAICGVVAVEWLMDAWADRATGDPAANKELRDRLMAPVEIPALGAAMVAVGVLAISRILLAVSANGAVIVAGIVAAVILGTATLYVAKPQLGRNLVAGLVLLIAVGVLAGGVIATAVGEREFEVHHGEETGETDETDHSGSDEGSDDGADEDHADG